MLRLSGFVRYKIATFRAYNKNARKLFTHILLARDLMLNFASGYRGIEQQAARQTHYLEAGGSSPPPATNF